jgi:hypothetical protein
MLFGKSPTEKGIAVVLASDGIVGAYPHARTSPPANVINPFTPGALPPDEKLPALADNVSLYTCA